ncbi:hypothetical protein [Xylella fastidiosa]|uniref:hypothetical protein n=1 Tax=Xylella fastidiosa TaxID=2371 RepID=UPI00132F94FB|nr:hypothetical protein [Xylella fastidiosa]
MSSCIRFSDTFNVNVTLSGTAPYRSTNMLWIAWPGAPARGTTSARQQGVQPWP